MHLDNKLKNIHSMVQVIGFYYKTFFERKGHYDIFI